MERLSSVRCFRFVISLLFGSAVHDFVGGALFMNIYQHIGAHVAPAATQMANKELFKSAGGLPAADTVNLAGGKAYSKSDEHALASFAATGCLSSTYYATGSDQLNTVIALAAGCSSEFIAKTAVYSRQKGYMKDMPALLMVILSGRKDAESQELFRKAWPKVIDNMKMVRNFVQIARSGKAGRHSLGSMPKRLIAKWLQSRTVDQLFYDAVGNDPSMADVLKLVHPTPRDAAQDQMFGYLLGKKPAPEGSKAEAYELFKKGEGPMPEGLNFQYLTSLDGVDWTQIARDAKWMMTRMNLNTFERHNVFTVKGMTELIAGRLADPELVKKARAFPYQLYTAYRATESTLVPHEVKEALHDAMEISVENVPALEGTVVVGVDSSGSMGSSISGMYARGRESKTLCCEVAGLIGAAILRKNPRAAVYTFDHTARRAKVTARDSVISTTAQLSGAGGGTNVSSVLTQMRYEGIEADTVVIVSDSESWLDSDYSWHSPTALMKEWKAHLKKKPNAKLILIDIVPNDTSQVKERPNILQVSGFSDQVFEVMATFANNSADPNHWVSTINKVEL